MCVVIFSTTFVRNISHYNKNRARYDQNCTLLFMSSALYSCPILMKLEFSLQIFEKYSNIKFQENPFSGIRVVPCWLTERRDEPNSLFAQFCERA
jgi:hypothetical protein